MPRTLRMTCLLTFTTLLLADSFAMAGTTRAGQPNVVSIRSAPKTKIRRPVYRFLKARLPTACMTSDTRQL